VWHQHVTLGEEAGSGRHSERWRFSSQATVTHDAALLSCKGRNTCPLMGSSE